MPPHCPDEPQALTLKELQERVKAWVDKNFSDGLENRPEHQALGMAEEYIELGQVIGVVVRGALKQAQGIRPETWQREVFEDAVADITIYLIAFCACEGIDWAKAVEQVWEGVRNRDWLAYRRLEEQNL